MDNVIVIDFQKNLRAQFLQSLCEMMGAQDIITYGDNPDVYMVDVPTAVILQFPTKELDIIE